MESSLEHKLERGLHPEAHSLSRAFFPALPSVWRLHPSMCLHKVSLLGIFMEDLISSKAVVPNLFGTRDWVHGRQLFHRPGWEGWFLDDSSALHLAHLLLCSPILNRPLLVLVCCPEAGDPSCTSLCHPRLLRRERSRIFACFVWFCFLASFS